VCLSRIIYSYIVKTNKQSGETLKKYCPYQSSLNCNLWLSVLVQGLEIVNPQAAEKRSQEANQKYFSSTAGFVNVNKLK